MLQLFSKERIKLLKQKYVTIVGKPKWAAITTEPPKKVSQDNEDEDFDLLRVNINEIKF